MKPPLWLILFLISKTKQSEWQITEGQPNAFQQAATEHTRICSRHRSCPERDGSSYCGFCTCGIECVERASCCLKMYGSFSHARESAKKNRHGCVRTQYLSPKNSDYNTELGFWMISKCDPAYQHQEEINMCTNPLFELDSVVPVTEPRTAPKHFRNKHCAYCNFVDKNTPLIYWNLQINSKRFMFFPKSDLLQELKKTRGNIMFIHPKYVTVEECRLTPENVVDTCNETGLWRNFNANVKTACESFIGPFNSTYRNIFCYMCNHGDEQVSLLSKDTKCRYRYSGSDSEKLQFSVKTDLFTVENGHNHASLMCDADEFQDLYSKICRKVFCYDKKSSLFNGECKLDWEDIDKTCFSLFIKLTPVNLPLPGYPAPTRKYIIDLRFASDIHDKDFNVQDVSLGDPMSGRSDVETIVFFKTNETDFVEYAIAYMVKTFKTSIDKRKFLEDIHKRPIVQINYWGELYMRFETELVSYNITITTDRAGIKIPPLPDESLSVKVDSLVSYTKYTKIRDIGCSEEKTIKKLHMCPYFKIRTDEIEFDIRNGYLFIRGQNSLGKETAKVLSQWEYEIDNGNISICLQDYFDIYHGLASPYKFASKCNAAETKYSLNVACVCIILFLQYIYEI